MLFFIYLISVAISVVVIYETTISFSKKMEKDGFLFVNKKSFWMQFKDYVSLIFKVCFPIANIFYVFCLLFEADNIYQKMVTCFFMDGKITFDETRLKKKSISKKSCHLY